MNTDKLNQDSFSSRHIGPSEKELEAMLEKIGVSSLEGLIEETVPSYIRLNESLNLPPPISEYGYLEDLKRIAAKNKVFKSYIGLGYYDCITPAVIQRNILENPGWYTQYTPYQAEISQGRLEALINFQSLVIDLTKMEVANASLLDEGTAAAEAMTMLYRIRHKNAVDNEANVFFVSEKCFPQTIEVIRTRAEPLGIEVLVGDHERLEPSERIFGVFVQYPDADGEICDYSVFIKNARKFGSLVAMASDLLSLTMIKPPGEFGADVVIGSSQRFGVPMGYGGPHAAFFATLDKYKRQVPGRIIGASVDKHGDTSFRMALQTREQHIRREKATSNICTAQSLPAILASMYAVYHGPNGLKTIAKRIHTLAKILDSELTKLGFTQNNSCYFDTLKIDLRDGSNGLFERIKSTAKKAKINFRHTNSRHIGISINETTQLQDVENTIQVFAKAVRAEPQILNLEQSVNSLEINYPTELTRISDYLTHPVFNSHQSETKMLRYIKRLENKDLSLTTSMIPLGSCTMKLNAASEMMPISWPEFSKIHPFAPIDQARGYIEVFKELEKALREITGFPAVSLQPNSGAQGEFAGLMVIRAYHFDKGQGYRNVVLVPSSAHGTNPASAVLSGMQVVVVECDHEGNIDIGDLEKKATDFKDKLAALMITYPSTHGVFEDNIQKVCSIVHNNGGQVYMDGANMNAQVGLTSPAVVGADVCHLNLHKTFSIPHGGGGPGMGPICVAKHLSPYLPGHPLIPVGGNKAISALASTPWGSGSILLVSYGYIRLLGSKGVTDVTRYAILNANYVMSRLEKYYKVLYRGANRRVAHEFILDLREFKRSSEIDIEDIAKRLIDYGFHAPTISWPVPGTMMIEPTESEDKDELDRFCDALISIHKEIQEIINGRADTRDNVLKNAPHTAGEVVSDDWTHEYSRSKAAYPLPFVKRNKFWPPVGRIDNAYGDRNLVCTCPPIENFSIEDL